MADNKEPTIYNNEEIRIVMVVKTGAGKSATGNTILGLECFESEFSFESVTEQCAKAYGEVDGQKVSVIDTPGLFDTNTDEETTRANIAQCISYASPGPHIFLIIIKLGRFTEEEKKTVEKIQQIFGEEANKYSMVLFTHGDKLKGKPIEERLRKSKDLPELVAKCNDQYHVFDNKLKDHPQVTELLNKIRKITEKNRGNHYTSEMFQKLERAIEEEKQRILKEKEEQMCKEKEEEERKLKEHEKELKEVKENAKEKEARRSLPQFLCEPTMYNNEEIRIVMVGKTGAGKSATANTILGHECFESDFSPESVTGQCAKAYGEVHGQKVSVIDTPGLFDTNTDKKTTRKNITHCITYASPGPHIFLIVIKLDRFTEEEKKTVEEIQKIFGEEANTFSMVLFTHGDQLRGKPIKKFLKDSKDLQELVAKCNGQYQVFDNNLKDHPQVTELLDKIRKITEKNRGNHYTTEMFQKAERAIEEKKQRILKKRETQRRKKQEELERKIKEKHDKELKEVEENAKKEKERILKEKEEQMRKEKEEVERKLKEKHDKELKEVEENAKKEKERILKEKEEQMRKEKEEEKEKRDKELKEVEENAKKEKERILKEKEDQMRKQQEEVERKIKEKHDKELKEVEAKAQKEKEALQKEKKEKIKAMEKEQEKKDSEAKKSARIEAENSASVHKKIKVGIWAAVGAGVATGAALAVGAAVLAPVAIGGAVVGGFAAALILH